MQSFYNSIDAFKANECPILIKLSFGVQYAPALGLFSENCSGYRMEDSPHCIMSIYR